MATQPVLVPGLQQRNQNPGAAQGGVTVEFVAEEIARRHNAQAKAFQQEVILQMKEANIEAQRARLSQESAASSQRFRDLARDGEEKMAAINKFYRDTAKDNEARAAAFERERREREREFQETLRRFR